MHKLRQAQFITECSKEKSAELWEQAISLARDKVETLQAAIAAFERYKANGDPFPARLLEDKAALR